MNQNVAYKGVPVSLMRDKKLKPLAKLLYNELAEKAGESGIVLTTKRELARLYHRSERTIQRHIDDLARRNWIRIETIIMGDEEAMAFLEADLSRRDVCVCCDFTYALHGHHYPVRAKDGGTKTVLMCPNHHALFHMLTDYGLHLNITLTSNP